MSPAISDSPYAITRLTALAHSGIAERHEAVTLPRLHKRHRLTPSGIITEPYDRAKYFDMERVPVTGVYELAAAFEAARTQPNVAFVRGELIGGARRTRVPRLTRSRTSEPATLCSHPLGRPYLVLDIDGIALERLGLSIPRSAEEHETIVRRIVALLPPWLRKVTFYYRWSQSAGLDQWKRGARLHLVFWLTRPVFDRSLVEQASVLGSEVVEIDTQVFHPAQLIYSADPTFEGFDDPISCCAPRSGLVAGEHDAAEPPPELVDGDTWRREQEERDNQRLERLERSRRLTSVNRPLTEAARRRYAEAALADAVACIGTAPVNHRHATIRTEAFSIGGLAGAGYLDIDRARAELAAAGAASGSHDGERTAVECFDAGIEYPRDLSHVGTPPPSPPDAPPPAAGSSGGGGDDGPVEIRITTNVAAMAQATLRALVEKNALLYVHGDELVTINRRAIMLPETLLENRNDEDWYRHDWIRASPLLVLNADAFLGEVALHTSWVRFDKQAHEDVPCKPSADALRVAFARRDWWTFRSLRGVIDMPTLRPNGTILDQPGFDRSTLLYFAPGSVLPSIDPAPSETAGRAAAQLLIDELLVEFPFVAKHDEAAALAMLLTTVVRYGIDGPTPLFAIDATTRGTGKTTLARMAMLLGGDPGVSTTPKPDSDEWGKRICAALRAGKLCWLFDNASTEVRSGELDAALTAWPVFQSRLLGHTQAVSYPATLVTFVTGNNLRLAGDLARRTVLCQLDAQMERPERRSFQRAEPERFVRDNRATFVAAALTLVRAYLLHGDSARLVDDAPLEPLGSYQAWSKFVREPAAWICGADPIAGQDHILEKSGDDLAWADFLEALDALTPEPVYEFLASTLFEFIVNPNALGEPLHTQLRNAFVGLPELGKDEARDPTLVSVPRLGQILGTRAGQIFHGRRLVQAARSSAGFRWRIERVVNATR